MFRLMLTLSMILGTVFGYFIDQKSVVTDCPHKKDLLTGKVITTTFDKLAVTKGGINLLYKAFAKVKIDSVPNGATTKFTIAFIVDVNGHISGERVIKDDVGGVGNQMIKIVKSFKWIPATCNGKKVTSLHTIPLQICLQ